jgi:hypothetical protein
MKCGPCGIADSSNSGSIASAPFDGIGARPLLGLSVSLERLTYGGKISEKFSTRERCVRTTADSLENVVKNRVAVGCGRRFAASWDFASYRPQLAPPQPLATYPRTTVDGTKKVVKLTPHAYMLWLIRRPPLHIGVAGIAGTNPPRRGVGCVVRGFSTREQPYNSMARMPKRIRNQYTPVY